MSRDKKVLLTAGYGPNELVWGEDMYDLMNSRLARGHNPFRMDSHCHYFALYLIAENLNLPVTVLENMNWEEFDAELDRGYDVIGIQLKSMFTDKVARMVARIREKCPDIIINNRSRLPEDFGTPEQHVTPEAEGRAWEACMTINDSWGYNAGDVEWKPLHQLLRHLQQAAAGGVLVGAVGICWNAETAARAGLVSRLRRRPSALPRKDS